jgi:CHASE2 domain-containing sensor protein
MIRTLVLLSLTAALTLWLQHRPQYLPCDSLDESYRDVLLANARDHFQPDPAKFSNVVHVQINEADKADYAAWPPPPIDLSIMLKRIAPSQPTALVITTTLDWGKPAPEFIPELADALLQLPRVIASIDVSTGTDGQAESAALRRMPDIERTTTGSDALPHVSAIVSEPAPQIAGKVELGLHSPSAQQRDALPIAYAIGQRVAPSALLQAITAATSTPFATQRISTGPGAALHLRDGIYIPLDEQGQFTIKPTAQVPSISALDLITPALANEDAAQLTQTLGTGKIIVLGPISAAPLAQAIAQALALPHYQQLGSTGQWTLIIIATLLGLHLLQRPKNKALSRTLLLLFLGIVASYLAFNSTLIWSPPSIPAAILLLSGLFVRVWGTEYGTRSKE